MKCSIETQAGNLTITASFGVSSLSAPDQLESSLKMADDAMYGAKEGGKNRVVVRDP